MAEVGSLLEAKLVLCRGFFVYAPAPGEVQIRSGLLGGQAYALPDPSRSGRLATLLGRLDGQVTLGALLGEWPEPLRPALLKLVGMLVEKGLLLPSSAVQETWLSQGLAPWGQRAASQGVGAGGVALVGAGVLGSRVAVNLVLSGVRDLGLWDPMPLGEQERRLSPAHLEAEPGTSRASSVARYLARLEPSASVEVLERPEPGGRSLWIVALDRVEPQVLHTINTTALRLGTPWLLATLDGSLGLVGPWVVPRQTGCYHCLESLWVSRSRKPEQLTPLLQSLREQGGGAPSFYGSPAFADAVAGLLLADLPVLLAGGSALTLGQVLAVDFTTLSAMVYPVPRLPRCPSCQCEPEPGEPRPG